jgi:metal-responsive CopG/Arc/MetJ family transcriptional regulator
MKVAVSIPDETFQSAEAMVRRLQTSRSALYARALEQYVSQHDPDSITKAINDALDTIGPDDENEAFRKEAARRALSRSEW